MTEDQIFRFREYVQFFNFDERSFIVDLNERNLYNLGASSALISSRLDGIRSVGDIVKILMTHYTVSESDAERVVENFLDMMAQKDLVENVDSSDR